MLLRNYVGRQFKLFSPLKLLNGFNFGYLLLGHFSLLVRLHQFKLLKLLKLLESLDLSFSVLDLLLEVRYLLRNSLYLRDLLYCGVFLLESLRRQKQCVLLGVYRLLRVLRYFKLPLSLFRSQRIKLGNALFHRLLVWGSLFLVENLKNSLLKPSRLALFLFWLRPLFKSYLLLLL